MNCEKCIYYKNCDYSELSKDQLEEIFRKQEIPEIWDYDCDKGLTCNKFKEIINE